MPRGVYKRKPKEKPLVPTEYLMDSHGEAWHNDEKGLMVRVKAELLDLEQGIQPGQLGRIAKARLHQKLCLLPGDEKVALGYIRTALEFDGLLGGPSELHLHSHQTLPPAVQAMLMEKMKQLVEPEVIEAEVVNG